MIIPTEDQEQETLFEWAELQKRAFPELALMFHIPNEGKRSAATGSRMRRAGLKSGVPDICIPVARGGYSALYIELKRTKGGKLSDAQREWLEALNANGNKAILCYGWIQAAGEITKYLKS